MRGHVGPKRAVTTPKRAVTMGRNTQHARERRAYLAFLSCLRGSELRVRGLMDGLHFLSCLRGSEQEGKLL